MLKLREKYDIVVVGAGPAGLAFIKTVRKENPHASILLLEKYSYPRDKICGDGISSLVPPLIGEIFPEIADKISKESLTQKYRIWYPSGECITKLSPPLNVIPRKTFDYLLWTATVDQSIDVLEEASATKLIFDECRAIQGIQFIHEKNERSVKADLIVGADGSNSIVRRQTSLSPRYENGIIAVRQYVKGIPNIDDGLVFFLDPDNIGYFWIFPFKKDGERWANIGYGTKKSNLRGKFYQWCEDPKVKEYLGDGILQGTLKGFPLNIINSRFAKLRIKDAIWGKGYLLLGDAAGLIHPYTGEGISAALLSGKIAAELYNKKLPMQQLGKTYQREIINVLQNFYALIYTSKLYILPCLIPPPWRALYVKILSWIENRKPY